MPGDYRNPPPRVVAQPCPIPTLASLDKHLRDKIIAELEADAAFEPPKPGDMLNHTILLNYAGKHAIAEFVKKIKRLCENANTETSE